MKHALSKETVEELLQFDPNYLKFIWRHRSEKWFKESEKRSAHDNCNRWNTRYAGKVAGSLSARGYQQITILGRTVGVHQIVWLLSTGMWPQNSIDHLDGNIQNNNIENLREVTVSENGKNRKRASHNTSGFTGVHFHKPTQKWVARICDNGKRKTLGHFDTAEEAHFAYASHGCKFGFTDRHLNGN